MNGILDTISSIERLLASHYDDLSHEEIEEVRNTLQDAQGVIGRIREERSQPPRGSELLWMLAGENPRAFRAYLGTFPNQEFNQFAQNPEAVQNAVRGFQQRITPPQGEVEGGVPKADLQSSNIYGFQYDPESSSLRVRFNNGGVYEYDGVPPFVYRMFERGAIPAKTNGQNQWGAWWVGKQPSLGATFHQLIRDHFPYERVA